MGNISQIWMIYLESKMTKISTGTVIVGPLSNRNQIDIDIINLGRNLNAIYMISRCKLDASQTQVRQSQRYSPDGVKIVSYQCKLTQILCKHCKNTLQILFKLRKQYGNIVHCIVQIFVVNYLIFCFISFYNRTNIVQIMCKQVGAELGQAQLKLGFVCTNMKYLAISLVSFCSLSRPSWSCYICI